MLDIPHDHQVLLMCSAQRALLGAVTPNLRAMTTKLNEESKELRIQCFFHGSISEKIFDIADTAIVEMSADFPEYQLDDHITRLDYPEQIPVEGCLVFLRYEPTHDELYIKKNTPIVSRSSSTEEKGENTPDMGYILYTAQLALLGAITPNLRAVTLQTTISERVVRVVFFYDGTATSEDFDITKHVVTEIVYRLPAGYRIDHHIENLDHPARVPVVGKLIFQRKED